MDARLLVSTRKGLLDYRGTSNAWTLHRTSFLGQNVTLALPDPRDGSLFAALDLGHFGVKLHRSTDEGATWEEVAVPVYPEGEKVPLGDGKPPMPASLKLIWALETGSTDQTGKLWAGTLPGGLFVSNDSGASWELVRGLWDKEERGGWFGGGYDTPGIHSVCVDPRNADVVRVGISCGGVWRSEDGGTSWTSSAKGMRAEFMPPEMQFEENIQDPHRLVQCLASPDHFWVQHHNGIFRSTDGAKTWTEIESAAPSGFGFAVAVHPTDPKTAWFVPGVKDECRVPVDERLVVSRTRDGGESFDIINEGLPEKDCFDLVFRHALAVDSTGDRLAFGSTTGNMWHSDDGGDSWASLATNLPPIHSVRFG